MLPSAVPRAAAQTLGSRQCRQYRPVGGLVRGHDRAIHGEGVHRHRQPGDHRDRGQRRRRQLVRLAGRHGCNQASWYADDTTTSTTNTAVPVYPDVQENFGNPLSEYSSISSSYAAQSSSAGDYEFAYDIWLNGYSTGHNEVMIWTQNHGQTPGGSLVASDITVSGPTWDLYASSDNSYIAFVPANGAAYPSGTLNLMAFFSYLMQNGNIATTSTLTQVDYGVEICNTDGAEGQFNFTNFSITTS
jgi:hypothetical protein